MHNFFWTRNLDFLCMVAVKADTMLSYSSTIAETNLVHNLQWHLWPCLRYIMRHALGLYKCKIILCHCCMENCYVSSYILTDHIMHLKVEIEAALSVWLWERGWRTEVLSLNRTSLRVTFKWYLFKYELCCWTDCILHRLDLKKVDASKKNGNLKVQTDPTIVSLQHQTGQLSANWSQVEGQNMLPSLADPQHSSQREKRLTQKKTITKWCSSDQLVNAAFKGCWTLESLRR
jgi:hypothetical protein